MKQWLSYLLIVLFSLQALPVKELGKLLSKKFTTEEKAGACDGNGGCEQKEVKEPGMDKHYLQVPGIQLTALMEDELVRTALHYLLTYKVLFHPDITTPPPDAVC